MSYPTEIAPTAVFGLIFGKWRFESLDMQETLVDRGIVARNITPRLRPDGTMWFLSNLQKASRFGFLIQKPWCFHFWFMIKPQKKDEFGIWIPESEFGYYLRIGKWRFDVPGTNGKHWMGPDSFHAGFHWD